MKVYDAASIRNVTIAGHSGAGKTQLTAAILFDAGMVNRFGISFCFAHRMFVSICNCFPGCRAFCTKRIFGNGWRR